ncbi:hypothetical protein PAXINDRAFT_167785 [Paxillus involutus ATCC 200175]|nr:hypothetical protein PAXINDRAFT_167785 [Paxillus involutus ATCC 200175]
MSTAEIKGVIEELTSGSPDAVTTLTLIALKSGSTFTQFHSISSAVYGVLDPIHLQRAKKNNVHKDPNTYPLQQALGLRSLASILPEWIARKAYAARTLSGLSDRWSPIHDWIIYLKTEYIDQESIDIGFRIVAKRCIVDFLGICRADSLGEMFNAVVTSPGIIAALFALWRLECQDRRFSPCLDDELPPPIFNIPAILDSWMCTFAHHERWNWPEILRPFNGDGAALATTALDHLQHDIAQTSINYDRIIWDIHLMTTLSINDAIRIPLLNQRSMAILAGVITLMVDQHPTNKHRPLVAKCISYACWYIRAYMEATDGLPWVTQVVEAGILPAMLATEPWLKHLKDKNEEDWEPLFLLLGQMIPKYSIFRSALRPMIKSLRAIEATGLPAKLKTDGPLFKAWSMFEKVIRNRIGLFDRDEGNETHIESCQNAQCTKSGPAGSFKRCGGCLHVHYCSRECQTHDWKNGGHQKYCRDIQARRANGLVARLPTRDLRFIDKVIAYDLSIFSDRVNEVATIHNVNPVVVELDYTDIPMRIGVGSMHSMPAPETCQCDASMRQKWDHMVELAQKSSKNRILVRAFIPGGTSPKVKLQVLPLSRILPDYDPANDEDISEFDNTFDHLYSCAGLSFGIIDDTFPDEAMRLLKEKTSTLTVTDTGLDALD